MKYDNEDKVSLLECLAGMIKKKLFKIKGCKLCEDQRVCQKIIKILNK